MYGVSGIPHQHQPFAGKVAGIAGGERDGAARPFHLAQAEAAVERGGELAVELLVVALTERLGTSGRQRPDDGAEIRLPQGQEGERPLGGEDLTRHRFVWLGTTHRRHQGMVAVIPAGERNVGLPTDPGVGTIGRHHQFGRQRAAIFQQQQGARLAALQAARPGRAQQLDVVGPLDSVQQRQLDDPVLDDVAKLRLTQAGGIEGDPAKAVLLPHLHLHVGLQAAGLNAAPGPHLLQDALAGQTQGADPVVRRLVKRGGRQLALDHGHLERTPLERGGEPQAHHAAPHNHHIHVLHLHRFMSFQG